MSYLSYLFIILLIVAGIYIHKRSSKNLKMLEKIASHIESASAAEYYEAVADDLVGYLSSIEQTMVLGTEAAAIERLRFKTAEAHNIVNGCSLTCIQLDESERLRLRKKLLKAVELADNYLANYKG